MWPVLYASEFLVLPTYLVVDSALFSLGIIWIYSRAKKARINVNATLDLCLVGMVSGFLGSRLTHILVEYPDFYLNNPSYVWQIWRGGFVFDGGMAGATAGMWMYSRWRTLDLLKFGDLCAPVWAAAYALGRLGCLAAGCCYGSPTSMPWGVSFPEGVEAPAHVRLHPAQVYASLWELGLMSLLLVLEKSKQKSLGRGPGRLFAIWLIGHGLGRLMLEQFRGDFRGFQFFNRSISTWTSGLVIVIGIYLLRRGSQRGKTTNASLTF